MLYKYQSPNLKSRLLNTAIGVLLILGMAASAQAKGGDILWQLREERTGQQLPSASTVDSAGNAIITGFSSENGEDYFTAKFKADGSGVLWRKTYDKAGGEDHALAVVTDSANNVIVTGYAWNGVNRYTIHTIKYDPDGNVLWQDTYNGLNGDAFGTSIAVDGSNNVYIGGYERASADDDFVILKYAPGGGAPAPIRYANTGPDHINSITTGAGGIAVAGYVSNGANGFDCMTIKYDYSGNFLWGKRYGTTGSDSGMYVKIDSAGNVVMTGYVASGATRDIYTAKYSGANGNLVWDIQYNHEGADDNDEPMGLWIDADDNVVMTGYTFTLTGAQDFYTAKYRGAYKEKLWEKIFNSYNGNADITVPTGIAVNGAGDVFVTGHTYRLAQNNKDFQTIKYKKDTGNEVWQESFNNTSNRDDAPIGIALAPDGNVYVMGSSDVGTLLSPDKDYYVVKYDFGALDKPTELNSEVVTETEIKLTWKDNSSAVPPGNRSEDKFYIEWKIGDFFEGEVTPPERTIEIPANAVTYNHTGLLKDTKYYYRIRSWNATDGYSKYSNTTHALTVVITFKPPVWVYKFAGGSNINEASAVAVGRDNHPVVTGTSQTSAYYTVKVDRNTGALKWHRTYDSGEDDNGRAIAVTVDNDGEVIVSGYSTITTAGKRTNDIYTTKYPETAASGDDHDDNVAKWGVKFNGPALGDDYSVAISTSTDANKNIAVVGYGLTASFNSDMYVIKYTPNGTPAWPSAVVVKQTGIDYQPTGVAFDLNGDVFVTGWRYNGANFDMFTAKYSGVNGAALWSDIYDSGRNEAANSLAVDTEGNVYVTGYTTNPAGNKDFFTIKYHGTTKAKLWGGGGLSYNGTANGDDEATTVKIDPISGDVMVAGTIYAGAVNNDFHVIRYTSSGGDVWQRTVDREFNDDCVVSMDVDRSGNVCIAGNTICGSNARDMMSVMLDYEGKIQSLTTSGTAGEDDATVGVAINNYGEAFIAGSVANSSGGKDYMVYKCSLISLEVPTPFNLNPSYRTISLSWQDNSLDENGYKMYRKDGTCSPANTNPFLLVRTTGANETSWTDDDALLTTGTEYCYGIQAYKNNGDTSRWYEKPVTTLTPLPPTNLSANAINTTQIDLAWTSRTNLVEDGFRVERCDQGAACDTTFTVEKTFNAPRGATTGYTYSDTTVCIASGITYRYRVVAYKNAPNAWECSPSSSVSKAPVALSAAPVLTATRASEIQINLSWTFGSADRTGFSVERCEGAACDFSVLDTGFPVTTSSLSYQDYAVKSVKTYRYRVRTYKTTSDCTWYGGYSALQSATTSLTAPVLSVPVVANSTQLNLTWTDNTLSETGFNIQRCLGSSCTPVDLIPPSPLGFNTTSYSDTGVCSGTLYRYKIVDFKNGLSNSSGGSWTKRTPINISNFQPGYQTKINLTYNEGMKADFSDIRFYDATSEYELPYWVETKTDGVSATVWLKTGGSNSIYVYYGNASAASSSNGNAVFDFYEDFDGTALSSRWTNNATNFSVSGGVLRINVGAVRLTSPLSFNLNSGYILEGRVVYYNTAANYSGTFSGMSSAYSPSGNSASAATVLYMKEPSSNNVHAYIGSGSAASYNIAGGEFVFTSAISTWYILGEKYHSNGLSLSKDYVDVKTYPFTWSKNPNYITLGQFDGTAGDIQDTGYDWVRVRKYAATEPSAAFGSEETSAGYTFPSTWTTESTIQQATTTTPTVPGLTAPNVVRISEKQINITWTDTNTDESGFKLERCLGAACDFSVKDVFDVPVNGASYTYEDRNIQAGNTYRYRVAAYKTATCGWTTGYSSIQSATASINAPTALAATAVTTTDVKLAWSESSATETGFEIDRCTAPCDFTGAKQTYYAGVSAKSYLDSTVCASTSYNYRVKAFRNGLSFSGGGCWTNKVPLNITGFQQNYQTKLTVNYASFSGMEADFRDMRFYDETEGAELPYWIESKTNGVSAVVWLKTGAYNNISMYFGNPSATAVSSAEATFEFYDDFDGTSIDTSKWTITDGTGFSVSGGFLNGTSTTGRLTSKSTFSSGVTLEIKAKTTLTATYGHMIGGFWLATNNNIGLLNRPSAASYANNGTFTSSGLSTPANNMLYTIRVKDTSIVNMEIYNLDTSSMFWNVGDLSNGVSAEPIVLGRRYDNNYTGYTINTQWDWIRVRKYAVAEPSVSFGSVVPDTCYSIPDTWSSSYATTTVPSVTTTAAALPTGFTITPVSARQLDLSWTYTGTDNTGFNLFRCRPDAGAGVDCTQDSHYVSLPDQGASVRNYSDKGLTASTTYTYRIRAFKTSSCPWQTAFVVASGATTNITPDNLTVSSPNTTQVNLGWNDRTTDESKFTIERCEGAACDFSTKTTYSANANGVSYNDTSVCKNTAYRYRVAAVREIANSGGGSWTKKVLLTISNFQANFQTKLVVSYDSDMQTNFNDLRFFDRTTEAELPYWIESKTDGVTATVWIKTGSNNNIAMHYGNPAATSSSNGDTVFEFFDDFINPAAAINTSKWTVTNSAGWSVSGGNLRGTSTTGRLTSIATFASGFVQEIKAKTTNRAPYGHMVGGFYSSTSLALGWLTSGASASTSYRNNSSWVTYVTATPADNLLYTIRSVSATSANMDIYNLDTSSAFWSVGNVATTLFASARPMVLGLRYDGANSGQAYVCDWDWVRVRKYAATEPLATLGVEDDEELVEYISPFSTPISITTPNSLVPSISATRTNENQIAVSWTYGSTDLTGYKLERCPKLPGDCADGDFSPRTTTASTSFNDTPLTADLTYTYRVKAYKTATCSWEGDFSAFASAKTTITPPALSVPTAPNTTQVNLSWTDNTVTETGFKVERCEGRLTTCTDNAQFSQVGANQTGTSYNDTSVKHNTWYTYQIRAFKTAGWDVFSGRQEIQTPNITTPTGLTATTYSDTRIDLTWSDANADETGFKVYKCTNGVCANFNCPAGVCQGDSDYQFLINVTSGTSHSDSTLTNSKEYSYRVTAYKTATQSWETAPSNKATAITTVLPPSGLTATAVNSRTVKLQWTDNSNDEEGFEIERQAWNGRWVVVGTVRSATPASTGNVVHNDMVPDVTVNLFDPQKVYKYRIKAYKVGGRTRPVPNDTGVSVTMPRWTANDDVCVK